MLGSVAPPVVADAAGSQINCCLRITLFLDSSPLYPEPPVALDKAAGQTPAAPSRAKPQTSADRRGRLRIFSPLVLPRGARTFSGGGRFRGWGESATAVA